MIDRDWLCIKTGNARLVSGNAMQMPLRHKAWDVECIDHYLHTCTRTFSSLGVSVSKCRYGTAWSTSPPWGCHRGLQQEQRCLSVASRARCLSITGAGSSMLIGTPYLSALPPLALPNPCDTSANCHHHPSCHCCCGQHHALHKHTPSLLHTLLNLPTLATTVPTRSASTSTGSGCGLVDSLEQGSSRMSKR